MTQAVAQDQSQTDLSNLTEAELQQKLKEAKYEAKVYQELHKLIVAEQEEQNKAQERSSVVALEAEIDNL